MRMKRIMGLTFKKIRTAKINFKTKINKLNNLKNIRNKMME